jgi:two-component system, OmpR family, sensor kinase
MSNPGRSSARESNRGAARERPARLGLRGRLALSIAAIVVIAFVITAIAVYRGTGSELRDRIDSDLSAEVDAIGARLSQSYQTPEAAAAAGRDYVASQPFGPSARLLIITVPGAGTVTNEPELVGTVDEHESEGPGARQRETAEAQALLAAPSGYSTLELVDAGEIRLLTEPITANGRTIAVARVGEPLESVGRAQAGVARTFAIVGALTLAGVLLATYLVAARAAVPLRRMARIATAVDAGDLTHRITPQGPRDEVRVLAESFDKMLDRLEDAFSRQGEFVSDASHELRTPLTAIRGQLEVLSREPNLSTERVRHVERLAGRELARMQRLVDDLLMLASLDERVAPQREPIELPRFLAELVQNTAGERQIELAAAPSGTLLGDSHGLAQVVRNLLRNAVEHTRPGGQIRVEARADGDRLVVSVEDDGPGISPHDRERIFDRFHRAEASRDRASGGSGLGLAIARAIVEAHQGQIWAEDSRLRGARVVFELPGFEASKGA